MNQRSSYLEIQSLMTKMKCSTPQVISLNLTLISECSLILLIVLIENPQILPEDFPNIDEEEDDFGLFEGDNDKIIEKDSREEEESKEGE